MSVALANRSPKREAWNSSHGSTSMKALFSHAHVNTVVHERREPAKNPLDKSVCAPNAVPVFRKKSATAERSMIFVPPRKDEFVAAPKSTSLHTDPFDGSRQTSQRPLCHSYGSMPVKPMHPLGMRHVTAYEPPSRGFVSSTGCVSLGGRRHDIPVRTGPMEIRPSPMKRPVSPIRPITPLCLGTEGFPNPPAPARAPISPSRRRSPMRDVPTLQGVMKPDPRPIAAPFISKPIWLGESGSGSARHSNGTSTPAAGSSCTQSNVGSIADSEAKQRKHFVSNKVRAPFHTNTPRQTPSSNVRQAPAPYC